MSLEQRLYDESIIQEKIEYEREKTWNTLENVLISAFCIVVMSFAVHAFLAG